MPGRSSEPGWQSPGGITTALGPTTDIQVSPAQFNINILNHGARAGQDATAAIEAAQAEAEAMPGNYGVFIPKGEWIFSSALKIGVPWSGIPRGTILKQSEVSFNYEGTSSWAVKNKGFSTAKSGKHPIAVNGIDFIFNNLTETEKQGFGLANCNGGYLQDSEISVVGTGIMTGLDIFACSSNISFKKVRIKVTTGAEHGACVWVRNRCVLEGNATEKVENITFDSDCFFSTNAGDEAISVFGSGGWIRNIWIKGVIEKVKGHTQNHLTSTILSTGGGVKNKTRVENIFWHGVQFIDLETESAVSIVGLEGDKEVAGTVLQNVQHIDCTWITKSILSNAKVFLNTPNNHEGSTAGISLENCSIYAESEKSMIGVTKADYVTSLTAVGNFSAITKECIEVIGSPGNEWKNLENLAKVEDAKGVTGTQALGVRQENGVSARLRGVLKATGIIKAGEKIGKLPEGVRPPASVNISANVENVKTCVLLINAAGEIIYEGLEVAATQLIPLDGKSWNIT